MASTKGHAHRHQRIDEAMCFICVTASCASPRAAGKVRRAVVARDHVRYGRAMRWMLGAMVVLAGCFPILSPPVGSAGPKLTHLATPKLTHPVVES
jgi:hypothetical protein